MHRIILSFLLLLIIHSLFAQSIDSLILNKQTSNIISRTWSMNDGLCSNSLKDIGQTKEGKILITSFDGITLFDGKKFSNYTTQNLPFLKSNNVFDFCVDSTGVFYIVTRENIIKYDKEFVDIEYETKKYKPEIQFISINSKGELFIADLKNIYKIVNNQLHKIHKFKISKNDFIKMLFIDSKDNIWVGTTNGNLYKSDVDKYDLVLQNKIKEEIIDAVEDNEGVCYFASSSTFYKYENDSVTLIRENLKNLWHIVMDLHNHVWISASNEIYHYDNTSEKFEILNIEHLPNGMTGLFFDRDHNMWIGTYREGLMQIRLGVFHNIFFDKYQFDVVPISCLETSDSTFWIGCDDGSIHEIKNNFYTRVKLNTKLADVITHMHIDSKKNKWICSYSGLLKISPDGKETLLNTKRGFPSNKVRGIVENKNGTYWVATENSGIVLIDEFCNILKQINNYESFSLGFVVNIVKGRDERVLISTNNGLFVIKKNSIIDHYGKDKGFNSHIVFNACQDANNTYWLATDNGAYIVVNDSLVKINADKVFSESSLFDVIEDDCGNIWLPNEQGIYRLNKSNVLDNIKNKQSNITAMLYSRSDGMDANYINPSQVIKMANGNIVLNTAHGISILDPSAVDLIQSKPNLVIRNIKADMKTYQNDGSVIKILEGSKYIDINYDYIDFINSDKIEISYMLYPFDTIPRLAQLGTPINYSNLPADKYTLIIKAKLNNIKESETSIKFVVLAPWYKNTWFIILIITVIALLSYLAYYYKIRNIEKQKAELEYEVMSRTSKINEQKKSIEQNNEALKKQKQELQEANIARDKLFSIIGHDLKGPVGTVKTLIDLVVSEYSTDSDESSEILKSIQESLASTYSLLENLLLWGQNQRNLRDCKLSNFSLFEAVSHSVRLVNAIAINKEITISKIIDDSFIVSADEEMIKTVIRNLISNSIKFTPNKGIIDVIVSQEEVNEESSTKKLVKVKITDNGLGISKDNIDKILNTQSVILSTKGTNNEQGTGLGLGICVEFLKQHNKKLFVSNNKDIDGNNGASFWFYLDKAE